MMVDATPWAMPMVGMAWAFGQQDPTCGFDLAPPGGLGANQYWAYCPSPIFRFRTIASTAQSRPNSCCSELAPHYCNSAEIGCGQKPRMSTARVNPAMQSLLIGGRTMGVVFVGSAHHIARMTLK